MPVVPIDGRKQYPKWAVEVVNAMNGRDPRAGSSSRSGTSTSSIGGRRPLNLVTGAASRLRNRSRRRRGRQLGRSGPT
jgi:hypothetical protein